MSWRTAFLIALLQTIAFAALLRLEGFLRLGALLR
jgi:hypothetical protein